MHHEIREGDTATIWVTGPGEKLMVFLIDSVFAIARSLGYTDIQFSVKRGGENWKRWSVEQSSGRTDA